MTIKIQLGVPTYNKAPEPKKQPAAKLFPFVLDGKWGKVWVSIPRPDKLWISGNLLPEHFPHKSMEIENYGPDLMASLATGQLDTILDTSFFGGIYRKVQLAIGENEASLVFRLLKAPPKSPAAHRLSVQLNPMLLGEEGFFALLDGLGKVMGGHFNFGAFAADARINRLDVAVDVVGVAVPDLLITADGGRKQDCIVSVDGPLETIQLFRGYKANADGSLPAKSKTNPLGPLLLVAYDKRREQIARGKTVKFGDAPYTRIEVRKTHFGPKPFTLDCLEQMSNPLAKFRVGRLAAACPAPSWDWEAYAVIRRADGKQRAEKLCQLSALEAAKYNDLYNNHPSDLLEAPAIWDHWSDAIHETGLIYMIEAAQQKCAGVPLPPEAYAEFG